MRKIMLIACGCLVSVSLIAQTPNIESVLQEIEQNNTELKAMALHTESRQHELASANNLPDPQAGAYYLPFGQHNTGDYTEVQLSQSLEFPSVYISRGNLIEQQVAGLELEYQSARQDILAAAKAYCLQVIYLNKLYANEQKRSEQAKTVFEQVQELFEKEQVGVLELNKAKVAWLQEQFKLQQIESEKQNVLLLLQNLNGGKAIAFQLNEYPGSLEVEGKDSLWQEKLRKNPELAQLKQQEVIAARQLQLSKNKRLPNLTAGYNFQGVSGSYYSGIYGGISIPLWSNRGKVQAAQSQLEYRESYTTSEIMTAKAEFETLYRDYLLMLEKFREYEATLSGLKSDELLLQAYQLGEVSFLEYHMELQFYRQAYDAMLEMQHRLYKLQTALLKHQL